MNILRCVQYKSACAFLQNNNWCYALDSWIKTLPQKCGMMIHFDLTWNRQFSEKLTVNQGTPYWFTWRSYPKQVLMSRGPFYHSLLSLLLQCCQTLRDTWTQFVPLEKVVFCENGLSVWSYWFDSATIDFLIRRPFQTELAHLAFLLCTEHALNVLLDENYIAVWCWMSCNPTYTVWSRQYRNFGPLLPWK